MADNDVDVLDGDDFNTIYDYFDFKDGRTELSTHGGTGNTKNAIRNAVKALIAADDSLKEEFFFARGNTLVLRKTVADDRFDEVVTPFLRNPVVLATCETTFNHTVEGLRDRFVETFTGLYNEGEYAACYVLLAYPRVAGYKELADEKGYGEPRLFRIKPQDVLPETEEELSDDSANDDNVQWRYFIFQDHSKGKQGELPRLIPLCLAEEFGVEKVSRVFTYWDKITKEDVNTAGTAVTKDVAWSDDSQPSVVARAVNTTILFHALATDEWSFFHRRLPRSVLTCLNVALGHQPFARTWSPYLYNTEAE